MISKFQIFYQPTKQQRKQIESFGISYYDFDSTTNTCKEKIVLEKNGEKHKIKRPYENADALLSMLSRLDLSECKTGDIDYNDEIYCIQCDNQHFSTNNSQIVGELLKMFDFDKLFEFMLQESK